MKVVRPKWNHVGALVYHKAWNRNCFPSCPEAFRGKTRKVFLLCSESTLMEPNLGLILNYEWHWSTSLMWVAFHTMRQIVPKLAMCAAKIKINIVHRDTWAQHHVGAQHIPIFGFGQHVPAGLDHCVDEWKNMWSTGSTYPSKIDRNTSGVKALPELADVSPALMNCCHKPNKPKSLKRIRSGTLKTPKSEL